MASETTRSNHATGSRQDLTYPVLTSKVINLLRKDKIMSKQDELHPVRFTCSQVEALVYIFSIAWDYYEEECNEIAKTIREYQDKETDNE